MSAVERLRTVEQERAAEAWKDVASVRGEKHAKKYRALVRQAAADVQVNGLGQTLAFWRAKNKAEHKALYGHVSRWVMRRLEAEGDLLSWVMAHDSRGYRHATIEAIAFLNWLGRFAEAELAD